MSILNCAEMLSLHILLIHWELAMLQPILASAELLLVNICSLRSSIRYIINDSLAIRYHPLNSIMFYHFMMGVALNKFKQINQAWKCVDILQLIQKVIV